MTPTSSSPTMGIELEAFILSPNGQPLNDAAISDAIRADINTQLAQHGAKVVKEERIGQLELNTGVYNASDCVGMHQHLQTCIAIIQSVVEKHGYRLAPVGEIPAVSANMFERYQAERYNTIAELLGPTGKPTVQHDMETIYLCSATHLNTRLPDATPDECVAVGNRMMDYAPLFATILGASYHPQTGALCHRNSQWDIFCNGGMPFGYNQEGFQLPTTADEYLTFLKQEQNANRIIDQPWLHARPNGVGGGKRDSPRNFITIEMRTGCSTPYLDDIVAAQALFNILCSQALDDLKTGRISAAGHKDTDDHAYMMRVKRNMNEAIQHGLQASFEAEAGKSKPHLETLLDMATTIQDSATQEIVMGLLTRLKTRGNYANEQNRQYQALIGRGVSPHDTVGPLVRHAHAAMAVAARPPTAQRFYERAA